MESQVVVIVRYSVHVHSVDKVTAVRFRPLGLTAYGDTEEEAMGNFKELFNRFIRAYREKGKLEQVLNLSGVEWWWREEYPEDRSELEGANVAPSQRWSDLQAVFQHSWEALAQANETPERHFALAA